MDYAIFFLRFGPGLLMLSFGIHQIQNPAHWLEEYAPQWVRGFPMITAGMRVHALVNILLGLALIFGLFFPYAAWVAAVWMASIVPFAWYRSWKTAMRDLSTFFALVALSLLLK